MKLHEKLPEGVTVDGRFYRLDFDFRAVLKMLEVLARDDLIPEAREYLALKCLTKHPKNVQKVMTAVRGLLFEQSPSKESKKITDFEQDAGLIRTAFRQAYGIDLFTEKLHWFAFRELLNNIPEGSRYSEVIGIRVRPMPEPTKYNQKEREWLLKAKADVALHLSEAEAEKKYEHDVQGVFDGLMALIQKGGGNIAE